MPILEVGNEKILYDKINKVNETAIEFVKYKPMVSVPFEYDIISEFGKTLLGDKIFERGK